MEGRRAALRAPFGFGVLTLLLLPSELGYQEFANRILRQPQVSDRAQKAGLVSAFGTHSRARFNGSRSAGRLDPFVRFTLASFDPSDLAERISGRAVDWGRCELVTAAVPCIDRSRKANFAISGKGDRLAVNTENAKPAAPGNEAQRTAALAPQKVDT